MVLVRIIVIMLSIMYNLLLMILYDVLLVLDFFDLCLSFSKGKERVGPLKEL